MTVRLLRQLTRNTTPSIELRIRHQLDRSPSSGGVRNSPWNMLNTSEVTFFILQQLDQLLLSFEISSIENQGCWVKTQGGRVIAKTVPPTVFEPFSELRAPTTLKNPGKRISCSRPFQKKNPRPKILSELEDRADWSWRNRFRNNHVVKLIVTSVWLTAAYCWQSEGYLHCKHTRKSVDFARQL